VDDPQPRDPPWGFILTVGAVAVVGILVLVVPGMLSPNSPSTTPRPTPTPDPHAVVTPAGAIAFGFEDGAIVIRRTTDGVTSELGRVPLAAAEQPIESGAPLSGASVYAMICSSTSAAGPERFLFGHIDFGRGISYSGPAAVGQGAPDGLFLFALPPGNIDPAARLVVTSDAGRFSVGAQYFELAAAEGTEQPSGCRIHD
jgi:hypothetical protein